MNEELSTTVENAIIYVGTTMAGETSLAIFGGDEEMACEMMDRYTHTDPIYFFADVTITTR